MYNKMSIAAMTLVGLAASAQANTVRFFSATDCSGNVDGDNSIMARFKEGCFNYYQGPQVPNAGTGLCGPLAIAVLPIIGNNSDTVDYDTLTVNYVNSNIGATINCTAFAVNSAGTAFASTTKSSMFASFPLVPVTGALTWTGSDLPNGGNAIAGVRTQTIFCSIPSRHALVFLDPAPGLCASSSSFSAVINYVVDTVQP
jgi:hypothetical protein